LTIDSEGFCTVFHQRVGWIVNEDSSPIKDYSLDHRKKLWITIGYSIQKEMESNVGRVRNTQWHSVAEKYDFKISIPPTLLRYGNFLSEKVNNAEVSVLGCLYFLNKSSIYQAKFLFLKEHLECFKIFITLNHQSGKSIDML